MISQIKAQKYERNDICTCLSERNLNKLVKSGQPIFLVAEVGMEMETRIVAEILTTQVNDGNTLDVYDEHLRPQQVCEQQQNHPMFLALAGIQKEDIPPLLGSDALMRSRHFTTPLLLQEINRLDLLTQAYLASIIRSRKVEISAPNNDKSLYETRPRLFLSASTPTPCAMIINNSLVERLRAIMYPQLLNEILPGMVEIAPLRKTYKYMSSYVVSYLKNIKHPENAGDVSSEEVYIDLEAIEALKAYTWPGNYDELRIILRRAFIFADGDPVSVEDVEEALEGFRKDENAAEPALKYDVPPTFELDKIMKSTEAHLIKQILKKVTTQKEAADILGFNSPQAFADRLRKLGVELPAHLGRKRQKRNEELK